MYDDLYGSYISPEDALKFAKKMIFDDQPIDEPYKYHPFKTKKKKMKELSERADDMKVTGINYLLTGAIMLACSFVTSEIILKMFDNKKE